MPVRIGEILEAEERLDQAIAEYREIERQPATIIKGGTAWVDDARQYRLGDAQKAVQRADANLRALQVAFSNGNDVNARVLPTIVPQKEGE